MQLENVTIQPGPLLNGYLTFGCDPEFFLGKDGKIVGSEKAIPVNGLPGKIIRDGIQVEMNPGSDHCRANLSNAMQTAFRNLKRHLDASKTGLEVVFSTTHIVTKKEMDSLSEQSKRLGCAPSHNIHGPAKIKVNPLTYRRRSAGGHIHVGLTDFNMDQKKELVQIMDVIIGNTCVLIDRDPLAAIRRRVYGRAGEYRLPKHGVEYRTLSNFWLHSYQLMSLVMGLARLSVSILHTQYKAPEKWNDYNQGMTYNNELKKYEYKTDATLKPRWPAKDYLMSLVDMKSIRRAINKNDVDLAWENWKGVRKFIAETTDIELYNGAGRRMACYYEMGLDAKSLDAFEHFARMIQENTGDGANGLRYWFKDDPLTHWINKKEGHGTGWETYIHNLAGKLAVEKPKLVIPKNL